MPETEILYDANGNPVEVTKPESPNVKQMRERIEALEARDKLATELEEKLAKRERSDALRDAGLQLDEDRVTALQAVHKGEWTPDAVKETAVKLGWAQAAPPQQKTPEQEAQDRLDAARTGGTTTPPDPEALLDAQIAAAKTPEELLAIYRQSGRPIAT